MFTDMVGYTALAQADEPAALRVLDEHNRLLRPLFGRYHGREVKTVGDAFLVEFESALDASRCAIEVQRALSDRNRGVGPRERIRVRIGLHVGDVVPSGTDVLGDAVNVASRVQGMAEPDGICLTQQVYDQVRNKLDVAFVRLPPARLKNLAGPLTVYKVGASPAVPGRPSGRAEGRSLAVLPLSNISPDPSDGYFADGLTEELISVLSQVPGLSVIARTSVLPYQAAPKAISEVGAELGVQTVLEGSVRKSGTHLRITLQLIDVTSQRHVWSNSYNREVGDVFAVQEDIAQRTAEALRLELGPAGGREPRHRPTANAEAYDLYLRALVAGQAPGVSRLDEAVRCFEQATRLDPTFAEAYAAWADLYVVKAADHLPVREVMPRARQLADRALALDPNSSDAHAALGNIALQFDHDWPRAEAEFLRAIELNPSNVTALQFLGLLRVSLDRPEEAREVLREAVRLDPGGSPRRSLAWAELTAGNAEAALRLLAQELDADPRSIEAHVTLGLVYAAIGRRDEARREAEFPLLGASYDERFDHALLAALIGRPEEARAVAAEASRGKAGAYLSDAYLAMLYSALGERDRALDLLEKDFREGDGILWLFHHGVYFDPLRGDPRFVRLLRAYGLPSEHSPGPAPPTGRPRSGEKRPPGRAGGPTPRSRPSGARRSRPRGGGSRRRSRAPRDPPSRRAPQRPAPRTGRRARSPSRRASRGG